MLNAVLDGGALSGNVGTRVGVSIMMTFAGRAEL